MENELGIEPLVDDLSTSDEGFFTLDNSLNSSTESFVELASLTSSIHLQPNVKTVIYPSAVLPEISQESNSKQAVIQTTLCGISSFQGFKMMTSSSFKFNNKCVHGVTLKKEKAQSNMPRVSALTTKENCSKQSVLPKCPTILKHRRKDESLGKDLPVNVSPIKPLSFSPSRFLNRNGIDSIISSDIKASDEISRELVFPDCTFDIEDSGIGSSDGDASSPLSPPSFTSTPVSGRSKRKCLQKSYDCVPLSPEQTLSEGPLQSTPKNSEDSQGTKTPVIRKFLHESTPRTPTPFKCPASDIEHEGQDSLPSSSQSDHFLSPERDTCFKKPSPVGPHWSARKWKNNGRHRTQKTARKALVLEQDVPIASNIHALPDGVPTVNCLSTGTHFALMHTSECEPSALVGNKTVTERRVVVSGKKSVYCTRRRKQTDKKKDLDKRWVAVACGHSFDQKVMTEAAKRCLRRSSDSHLPYFKKL